MLSLKANQVEPTSLQTRVRRSPASYQGLGCWVTRQAVLSFLSRARLIKFNFAGHIAKCSPIHRCRGGEYESPLLVESRLSAAAEARRSVCRQNRHKCHRRLLTQTLLPDRNFSARFASSSSVPSSPAWPATPWSAVRLSCPFIAFLRAT